MKIDKEKLEQIAVQPSESSINKAKWRKENRRWLKKSQQIALAIHYFLRKKGMSQKQLAEKMGVSPAYVGKLLKGQENLTLETIGKIEIAINESLFSVVKPYEGVALISMPRKISSLDVENESEKYIKKSVVGGCFMSIQYTQEIA